MMTSEVMDHFLTQQLENAESMIDLLYECYASKATTDNELIRESFFVLERCTKDMPYEVCDQISAAMISACVECERLAFLDGVALGVKLMMELTRQ